MTVSIKKNLLSINIFVYIYYNAKFWFVKTSFWNFDFVLILYVGKKLKITTKISIAELVHITNITKSQYNDINYKIFSNDISSNEISSKKYKSIYKSHLGIIPIPLSLRNQSKGKAIDSVLNRINCEMLFHYKNSFGYSSIEVPS